MLQADVFVNTTNQILDLAQGGGVSAALLRAAGQSLQAECHQHGSLDYGEVVTTQSGAIKQCNYIYHVALKSYNDEEAVEVIRHCG